MKCIIVEDYLYDGNKIFGVLDSIENFGTPKEKDIYILDDGDMFCIEDLRNSDYIVYQFDSDDIIKFYFEFLMNKQLSNKDVMIPLNSEPLKKEEDPKCAICEQKIKIENYDINRGICFPCSNRLKKSKSS